MTYCTIVLISTHAKRGPRGLVAMTWRHNSAQLLRLIESQAETIAARGAQSDLRPYAPRGQQRWRRERRGTEVLRRDQGSGADGRADACGSRGRCSRSVRGLFCWSELDAKHVGIIQSLIVTCRLHRIDPCTYLVDVLQQVGEHPVSRVAELTSLLKAHFAEDPLRSDLSQFSRC
jgi:transposase